MRPALCDRDWRSRAAIGARQLREGLAIGVSANTGEIGLATVLSIGFAVHNVIEGFGIVGPLGGPAELALAAIAGSVAAAPSGSMVGYNVSSEPLELRFYSLSAGAILYVIGEVWTGMRTLGIASSAC